jgi:hypothetical protein
MAASHTEEVIFDRKSCLATATRLLAENHKDEQDTLQRIRHMETVAAKFAAIVPKPRYPWLTAMGVLSRLRFGPLSTIGKAADRVNETSLWVHCDRLRRAEDRHLRQIRKERVRLNCLIKELSGG